MTDKSVKKSDSEWRAQLDPEQYAICRQKGTEPAFSGKYYKCRDDGIYRCACCGNELFSSETKYDSGSGWPSYYAPISTNAIKTESDASHGMQRIEVMCNACDAHLGHVFTDGPRPTGLRYCVNSTSLKLEKSTT